MSATLFDEYARIVREHYVIERNNWHRVHENREARWGERPISKWDGTEDLVNGRKSRSVWKGVAKVLIESCADVSKFMKAQFYYRADSPPEPNVLLSPRAMEMYKHFVKDYLEMTGKELDQQKDKLGVEITCAVLGKKSGDILESVLSNRHLSFSPLFRYCSAIKLNRERLAEMFFEDALLQYLGRKNDYDLRWGEYVPVSLRSAAAGLIAESKRQKTSSVVSWVDHSGERALEV